LLSLISADRGLMLAEADEEDGLVATDDHEMDDRSVC
jgi:hypothetical protein